MRQLTYSDICGDFGMFDFENDDVRGIPLCQEILNDVFESDNGRFFLEDSDGCYIEVVNGCILCDENLSGSYWQS